MGTDENIRFMKGRSVVIEVDARGLVCPLPILRLAKAIGTNTDWSEARLVATDPDAVTDVEAFCRERGLTLRGMDKRELEWFFEIGRERTE